MKVKKCLRCGNEVLLMGYEEYGTMRGNYCSSCEMDNRDAAIKHVEEKRSRGWHVCDADRDKRPCLCGKERVFISENQCSGCDKTYRAYLPKCIECLELFWNSVGTPEDQRARVRSLCVSNNLKT